MSVVALQRKLTTILVADVAGYSRLMGRDEEGTHARLVELHCALIGPAIGRHGGTLVNTAGDGLLAEFDSVVEAVRCALEIQRVIAERNAAYPPDERIALRIGINIGDVIVAGGDLRGDGVNVAARLEGLAEPGGIAVSQLVREHLRDKLDVAFEDMGEQQVKNIARPMRTFRVRIPASGPVELAATDRGRRRLAAALAGLGSMLVLAGGWWCLQHPAARTAPVEDWWRAASAWLQSESGPGLSVVVLPFVNLAGDPQQDYLADGITESLTTDLSRALPGSFVVARATAFTYKCKPVDARQVGLDLNVRYLLQGSVLRDGDRLRVNAQLVEARSGTELWAERFDTRLDDVFDVQDQIVGRLSRAVGLQVVDLEARRSERARPANPSAVEFVMRGQAMANRPSSRDSMIAARTLFRQALEHDADNVDALAGVAATLVSEVLNSYYDSGREDRLGQADALTRRALESDPRHIVALKARAGMLRAEGRFEDAKAASQAVLALNPGEPWAYKEMGLNSLYVDRLDEALKWFRRADRIGPRDPGRWIWLEATGRTQFFLGHNDEAIRLFGLSIDANPRDSRAYAELAAVNALSGRSDEARAAMADCLRLRPGMTVKRLFDGWSVPLPATNPGYRRNHNRLREGLRLAGMPEE